MVRWRHLGALVACCATTACSTPQREGEREDRRGAPLRPGAERQPVADDRLIPKPPPSAKAGPATAALFHWIGASREILPASPAAGVDALDEVRDSAWFTNRNTVRALSPAAMRRGPGPHPAPRDGSRWSVTGMKETGFALGVRARDEQGAAFFLKFDPQRHDEVETGADVVVQRLLFAAGYNVPENDIVYVPREAL
ncbi:MAG: hypothetical protein H0X17_11290, partial [Deltaproteobacteria bacterium]|nr:hypothetical protein [Deltaproteobacteria bacterium]